MSSWNFRPTYFPVQLRRCRRRRWMTHLNPYGVKSFGMLIFSSLARPKSWQNAFRAEDSPLPPEPEVRRAGLNSMQLSPICHLYSALPDNATRFCPDFVQLPKKATSPMTLKIQKMYTRTLGCDSINVLQT